jgi:hypothetical protein
VLLGSLVWIVIGVGYAWSVRNLARLTRAAPVRKLTLRVDDVPIGGGLRRGA